MRPPPPPHLLPLFISSLLASQYLARAAAREFDKEVRIRVAAQIRGGLKPARLANTLNAELFAGGTVRLGGVGRRPRADTRRRQQVNPNS